MQGPTNTLREEIGARRTSRETDAAAHRHRSPDLLAVRELAQRLTIEYCGAVPPGRVAATVCRAYLIVVRYRVAAEQQLETCESIARRQLTDMVVSGLRAIPLPLPAEVVDKVPR